LVVDDDADLSTLLASIIADQGHDVRTAANGRDALDRISERMPDLILLDVMMPTMGGQEFAARFRDRYGDAARIVVMTAATSAAAIARDLGADAWLAKPFDVDDVSRVLASGDRRSPHRPSGAGH
jgi:DNA-binding response OmpR family regulator